VHAEKKEKVMANPKVLMTGAAGYIASQLLPTFRARYELVMVDVTQKNREGEEVKDIVVLDLIDPDRSRYARYFEGVDAVVHLGYKRGSGSNPRTTFLTRNKTSKWHITSSGPPMTPVSTVSSWPVPIKLPTGTSTR
jgi:hypothetical protein